MSNFVLDVPVPLNTLSVWSRGTLHEYFKDDGATLEEALSIWRALLTTLRTPTLSDKQTTSTCNCVRIFLKSIPTAKIPEIRDVLLTCNEWLGCYHAVRDAWPRAKVKPLMQVLEVLLQTAKKHMSEDELEFVWRTISFELSVIVLRHEPSRHLKGALALSAFFLDKNLSYETYLHAAVESIRQGGNDENDSSDILKYLVIGTLAAFEQHDAQSSAEKCFKALLRAQNPSNLHFWWSLVREFVTDHVDSVDTIATSIFPLLLEQETSFGLDLILSKCYCKNQTELLYCLALLQSLRDQERISQDDILELLPRMITSPDSGAVDIIELLLCHANDGVRVRVLRLLVTSKMTNAPMSLPILRYIRGNISLWSYPGGSHERGELLSIIRRLLIRLRGGSSALEKTASSSIFDMELLNAHKAFVAALLTGVITELRSNASYQRHIMSLSILKYLFESKIDSCDRSLARTSNDPDWPFSLCLRQASMAQDLLKLVSDAYEDVRALSGAILRHLLISGPNTQSQQFRKQLQSAINSLIPALELDAAQTNRSDKADGLGRYYSLVALTSKRKHSSDESGSSCLARLLDRLERILTDQPIFDKPGAEPLHSLLLGVMYCVEDVTEGLEVRDRIISISVRVWRAVAERLCVDSPETETSEVEDKFEEVGNGPKDMLSYAWRALRDSSLVLRSLLNPRGLESSQVVQILGDIGNLCMEQLITLRHRGAFSTVAQTFTICCQRAQNTQGQALTGLRREWYEEAEAQIDQQASRLTRRSAGLPAMLAGILSPDDPVSFGHFVASFIAKSQVTALDRTDRLSLPQVHAMNTLREVMINSRFRSAIIPHVNDLLALSAQNLGSDIWAIQNCGLMLYRACILRFPVEDDGQAHVATATEPEGLYSPVKLAIELLRYGVTPALVQNQATDTFLDEKYGNALGGVEQKFASLDMISHVRPAEQLKSDAFAHITILLSSPVWLIRERAAEVLAMLVPLKELRGKLNERMNSFKPYLEQNTLHGILLLCRQLIERWIAYASKSEHPPALDEVVQMIVSIISQVGYHRLAPPVWAALFEIANAVSEQSLRTTSSGVLPLSNLEHLLNKAEIREYYLPETGLIYNLALQLINAKKSTLLEDNIFSTILESMERDSNVATCILKRLLGQAVVFPPQALLRLCCVLLPESHSDATPLMIDMVSFSVETSSPGWDTKSAQQMLRLLNSWSLSREGRASSMIARARLASLLTPMPGKVAPPDNVMPYLHRLEKGIGDAARNEMDTHIRLQATRAISAYLPAFPGTGIPSFGLLLTLRDLLTDDDEDVRFYAAHTASTFLNKGGGCLHSVLAEGASAYAISIRLEDHLHAIFCESAIQPEVLLCRILGVNADINLETYLIENPIKQQVEMINNESRALFAVERQNLYIDEVREIGFWSSMWATMAKLHPQLPEKVKAVMASWVFDGLGIILTMLEHVRDVSPMLPNLTHDVDTLILCLRVVRVVEVCVGLFADEAEDRNSMCQRILKRLHELKVLSSQCHFNPELSCAVMEILN